MLVTVVVLMMVVSVFAMSLLSVSVDSSRQTAQHSEVTRLQKAGESAIALGAHQLWSGYVLQQGGAAGTVATFRQYLDAKGLPNMGAGATPNTAAATEIVATLGLPAGGATPFGLGGTNIASLGVVRADEADSTTIYFTADVTSRRGDTATAVPTQRIVQEAYVAENGPWAGLEYVLLGNNVNCIMCHAQIGSADMFYNEEPSLFGTFDRVRVGTLESLLLRSSADSEIGGTLYVRGIATDRSGNPITDWSDESLKAWLFDPTTGLIEQSSRWGEPSPRDLDPASETNPEPYENLYLDYPSNPAEMVDGYLPEFFPPPFPDENGNRMVEPLEFANATSEADGTVTGMGRTVYPGESITSSSELSSALRLPSRTLGESGAIQGNVVLIGDEENPIVLEGDVAIDGDLVIEGYLEGDGTLFVSGNVYIPSSLQYKDGEENGVRTFGVDVNGDPNNLVLAAGGSVMIGDLFYTKGKTKEPVTGNESGYFSFAISELALFNRGEWAKTQPMLPGKGEITKPPSEWTQPNPDYRPGYVPRYYVFNEDGTIPIYNGGSAGQEVWFDGTSGTWLGEEHPGKWNPEYLSLAYPSDPNDPYLYDSTGAPIAAVHELMGTNGWISDAMLQQLMRDAVAAHRKGTPVEVDALIYTNNSIFGLVGKSTPMGGQMIVNGALIAADVGLLVPGDGGVGLRLNYDPRGKSKLLLEQSGPLTLTRRLSTSWAVRN